MPTMEELVEYEVMHETKIESDRLWALPGTAATGVHLGSEWVAKTRQAVKERLGDMAEEQIAEYKDTLSGISSSLSGRTNTSFPTRW